MSKKKISIRRARPDDAAAIACLMDEPVVYSNLMQMPYASEEVHRTRIADSLLPGKTDLLLVAERDGKIVGSAGMHATGPALRRRHVVMIGLSVVGAAQRQGVGTALMQALCDYADRWMGVLPAEPTILPSRSATSRRSVLPGRRLSAMRVRCASSLAYGICIRLE